ALNQRGKATSPRGGDAGSLNGSHNPRTQRASRDGPTSATDAAGKRHREDARERLDVRGARADVDAIRRVGSPKGQALQHAHGVLVVVANNKAGRVKARLEAVRLKERAFTTVTSDEVPLIAGQVQESGDNLAHQAGTVVGRGAYGTEDVGQRVNSGFQ